MTRHGHPALSVALSDQHPRLGSPSSARALGPAGHARRRSRRRARPARRATGFDWVWLLGVWQTGAAGRAGLASTSPSGAREYRERPARLHARTTSAARRSRSADYTVHEDFGGDAALARLRERLARARPAAACSTSCRTTPPSTTPGSTSTRSSTSHGHATTTSPREPQNYGRVETARRPARSSPTAATPTSPAGPTRSSSTTATRRCARR